MSPHIVSSLWSVRCTAVGLTPRALAGGAYRALPPGDSVPGSGGVLRVSIKLPGPAQSLCDSPAPVARLAFVVVTSTILPRSETVRIQETLRLAATGGPTWTRRRSHLRKHSARLPGNTHKTISDTPQNTPHGARAPTPDKPRRGTSSSADAPHARTQKAAPRAARAGATGHRWRDSAPQQGTTLQTAGHDATAGPARGPARGNSTPATTAPPPPLAPGRHTKKDQTVFGPSSCGRPLRYAMLSPMIRAMPVNTRRCIASTALPSVPWPAVGKSASIMDSTTA